MLLSNQFVLKQQLFDLGKELQGRPW